MRLRPIMPHRELQELGIYRKISLNQQIRTKRFRGSKWRVLFLFKRCIYVSECLTPYMYVYQMQPCTCRGQRRVRRSDNLWNWRLHVGVGNQTQILSKNKCAYLLSHFSSPRTTVKHSKGESGDSSVSKEAYQQALSKMLRIRTTKILNTTGLIVHHLESKKEKDSYQDMNLRTDDGHSSGVCRHIHSHVRTYTQTYMIKIIKIKLLRQKERQTQEEMAQQLTLATFSKDPS